MSSRSRSLVRVFILSALLAALIPAGAAMATRLAGRAADAAPASPGPGNLLLRPSDLQIGYFGFSKCTALEETDDTPPKLSAFIRDFKPKGCIEGLLRTFKAPASQEPDPILVGSAVLDSRSPAEANAALAVLPELLGRIGGNHPAEEVAPPTRIGDMTRLFHLDSEFDSQASALIWRSGSVLAGVLVGARSTQTGGGGFAFSDAVAAVYAARQQAHIETRTPYVAPARVKPDAPLDDPQLGLDVHWLGLGFHPGHGLRSSRLYQVASGENAVTPSLFLEYRHRLSLEIWKRPAWQRQHYVTHGFRASHCTTASRIALPQGHAVLYAGQRRHYGGCQKGPPNAFLADAYLGKTVVTVSPGTCAFCAFDPASPFDSRPAVLAALHDLRLRQPRPPR